MTELRQQYELLQGKFPGRVRQVEIEDAEAAWANAIG